VEAGLGVAAGAKNGTLYNHYSLLAGIEKHFGLPRLSNAQTATPLPIGGSAKFQPESVTGSTSSSHLDKRCDRMAECLLDVTLRACRLAQDNPVLPARLRTLPPASRYVSPSGHGPAQCGRGVDLPLATATAPS